MAQVNIERAKVGKAVGRLVEPEIRKRLEIAVERARSRAGRRSGELQNSIGYEVSYSGPDGVRGRLFASADHAGIVHRGRSAIHSTTPMVFIAAGGAQVFTHSVSAVPANPFLTDAARSVFGGAFQQR